MATGSRPQSVKGRGREIFFGADALPPAAERLEVTQPPERHPAVSPSPTPQTGSLASGDDGLDRVTLYIRSDQSLKLDTIKNRLKVRRKQKGLAPRAMAIDRSSIARLAIDLLDEHDIEELLQRLET